MWEQFNMSAVSYELLLLTHVSGAAWRSPRCKLSTIGGAGMQDVSADPLFRGYFQFSGHCFCCGFFPRNTKARRQSGRLLVCWVHAMGWKRVAPLRRLLLKPVWVLRVFSRTEPLGFVSFLGEWDIWSTKNKKKSPGTLFPVWIHWIQRVLYASSVLPWDLLAMQSPAPHPFLRQKSSLNPAKNSD